MPVPTHFRLTVRGVFLGTLEAWSNTFHFSRANEGAGDAGLDDVSESGVTDAVVAFYGAGFVAPMVGVSDWRLYQIGTDNKMEGNGPLQHEFVAGEVHGNAGATVYPPQIALAISTVAVNRGAAQFGRFYLPGPTRPLDGTARISAADANVYVGITEIFLKSVSDQIDLLGIVQSAAVHVSPGPAGSPNGTIQEIDHVRCGRVYDTIRTRRQSLEEDYQAGGHIDW